MSDALQVNQQRSRHLWQALQSAPHAHDLFQVLRRIDALSQQPALGHAVRPQDEPLRIGQEPSLAFATAEISEAWAEGGTPSLSILSFGLFGPNGPLPLHLTEYVRERKYHYKDTTFSAFVDIFHHRLTLLFYRAWAQAEAVVSLDRDEQHFAQALASLLHLSGTGLRRRDQLGDHAKLALAGHLARQTRNAEGLAQILRSYFGVPVNVEENVETWVELDPSCQVRIGRFASRLGSEQLLGRNVRDGQSRFRLVVGPLSWSRYQDFLPGAPGSRQLRDWVRLYVGFEFDWDLRLLLHRDQVPSLELGSHGQIGYGSWIGRRQSRQHADDLLYAPERVRPLSSSAENFP